MADPGSSKQVFGNYHYKLEIPDIDQALLFFQLTPPSLTVDGPDFKTWDAQGNPINSIGGGRQATWSDVQISRGIDSDMSLYKWIDDVRQKGATDDTKKDIKITVVNQANEDLLTWNVTGAVISSYTMAGVDSNGGGILTESVSITFQDASLEA